MISWAVLCNPLQEMRAIGKTDRSEEKELLVGPIVQVL